MRPYLVSALVLAIFSFILGNYVIPPANQTLNEFRQFYIDNVRETVSSERNIHRQIEPGVFIYMQSFNPNNVGYRFTLEYFEDSRLIEKITAENIRWDEEAGKWILNNWWRRRIHESHEEIEKGYRIDTTLNMTPEDYKVVKNEMENYTTPALKEEIGKMKMRGVNTVEWELEKHKRLANPFSAFILTIIGAGLASRKIKGGLGFHLGLGLLLSFSYIMFMQVSTVFAVKGNAPPLLAVWIPNLGYSIIAFFVFRWAAR
jgi:lipopolysaccharide export system permease protein